MLFYASIVKGINRAKEDAYITGRPQYVQADDEMGFRVSSRVTLPGRPYWECNGRGIVYRLVEFKPNSAAQTDSRRIVKQTEVSA